MVNVYLDCDRRKKKELRDLDNAIRRNTCRKGVGCRFRVKVVQRLEIDGYRVVPCNGRGYHNHPLIVYKEGHRQVSGLSPAAKKIVHDMSDAKAKPHAILAAIKIQFPDLNPNRRHIYNMRARLRELKADGRNPAQNFLHLAVQHNYVFWIDASDDGVVTSTFVAHPISVNLLRTYPYVIALDTTYKTNKYSMPLLEIIGMTATNKNFLIGWALMSDETEASYRWVLQQLRNLIGFQVQPTCIVTDRELALMRPIAQIFPLASHLLCTFHINKDVAKQVYLYVDKDMVTTRRFLKGVWKRLMTSTTVEGYERCWQQILDSWAWCPRISVYLSRTWLPYKEMFVKAWTNKVLHFGNTTTCRVESAHASLKLWIESPTSSMDTLFETVNTSIEMQLVGIRNDLESSIRKQNTEFQGPPYQHLHGHVSHFAMGHIKKQIHLMHGYDDEIDERCTCALYTSFGLPCACRLDRLMRARRGIYLDEIHPFFRTLRIGDGLDIPEFVDECAQDRAFFRAMVDEVEEHDVSMMRGVSQMMYNQLHPEHLSFDDPPVNENVRGRPRSSATRRDRSGFEFVFGRGRGRGRSTGSSSRGQGRSASSVNMASGTYITFMN